MSFRPRRNGVDTFHTVRSSRKSIGMREPDYEKAARVSVESCPSRLGGYEEGRTEEEVGWRLNQGYLRYGQRDYR
jgi:hypothetical protein